MADEARSLTLPTLARRAADGDAEAFRLLVQESHATVYRLALRVLDDVADAEDVVQETYAKAWHALSALRDMQAVLGWLCRIARNLAYDRLRSRKVRRTVSMDAPMDAAQDTAPDDHARRALVDRLRAQEPLPDAVLHSAQLAALVREVMAQLSDDHRVVLMMKEVDGMTAEEIGVTLGVPAGTVESRLVRGRAILAKKIMARGKRGFFS